VLEAADADLFDVVKARGRGLGESEIRRLMWQLCVAVSFLHREANIGHNDISLENLLVKDGLLKLMDFGQATELTVDADGEEAFAKLKRPRGKRTYMAPEMHSGLYQSAPADVFACGVVFFILIAGSPPWRTAEKGDACWDYVRRKGLEALLMSWQKQAASHDAVDELERFARLRLNGRLATMLRTYLEPVSREGTELLTSMLNPDPAERPTAEQCLASSWFAPLRCPVSLTPAPGAASMTRGRKPAHGASNIISTISEATLSASTATPSARASEGTPSATTSFRSAGSATPINDEAAVAIPAGLPSGGAIVAMPAVLPSRVM
jgi:serine/threonine protein kinase